MLRKNKIENQSGENAISWARLVGVTTVSALLVVVVYFVVKSFGGSLSEVGFKPTNIQWRRDEVGNIMLTWKTKSPTIGMVIYGNNPERLFRPVMSSNEAELKKDHLLVITESPNTPVYFMIFSGGKLYGDKGSPFVALGSDADRSVVDQKGQP